MEASDTSGQNPGTPEQSGELGQPQPGSTGEVAGSQDQPTRERQAQDAADPAQAAQPVEDAPDPGLAARPVQTFPSSGEQQAAHDERERAREAQRREHNERTGGGAVQENELNAHRDEHNTRVAGDQPTQPAEGSDADQA